MRFFGKILDIIKALKAKFKKKDEQVLLIEKPKKERNFLEEIKVKDGEIIINKLGGWYSIGDGLGFQSHTLT